MARYEIESFKYGLDTRKSVLTSPKGALLTLNNMIVNSGGELVRRPGLFLRGTFSQTDSISGLSGVFYGVAVDASSVVVFGSSLTFGASVTQGQPTLSSAISVGSLTVTYQQLKHPSLYNDTTETYSASLHRMVDIKLSTLFEGQTFAIAEFSDGNRFMYLNGALVQHSANGLVLAGRIATSDLSSDLLRQVQAVNWNGIKNTDENGTAQNGSTIINSPLADYFGVTLTETSSAGLFGNRFISKDATETNGVRAIAKFKVTVAGTFELFAPLNEDGTGSTSLMSGTITAGTVAACVTAIIAGVNDFTSYHGYSASAPLATTDEVQITAPQGYDLVTGIDLTVTPTAGGAVGASTGATPFTARFVTSGNGTLSGQRLTYGIGVPSSQADNLSTVGVSIGIETTGGGGTTTVAITQLGGAAGQPMQARTSPNNYSPIAFSAALKLNGQNDSLATFSIALTNGSEIVTLQLTVYLFKVLST